MRLTTWLAAFCLGPAAVSLAIAGNHAELNGIWKASEGSETISIHQKEDAVQIAETAGKESNAIECNTTGQACKIKGGEVTLWYNGDTLVMMQTTHGNSRVVKKRLKISTDGKLEEEIIHISPAGSTEKLSLVRQSGS